ncbi:DUF4197 domain-containing protein [Mucilaginibacter arboris]|uniref:DUF4197 family protein n=1 Tax=Mucilaginibacter arboris TaxID=2682090 RepID=A0A7K1SZZ4_9SPHI|nr:DUF4197 domain-containing protein [Mucilaginibacter arboris]MVN22838.1 DUF4197 family protein [Mucilaginibacter arboris]
MKKQNPILPATLFTILFFTINLNQAHSQVLNKLLSKATKTNTAATPSDQEISTGIKEALQQGIVKSSDQLSAVNGFFGNAAVKILFPPEAQKAENTLRKLGLNKLCDNVILSLNRAAEDAAKEAKPIFISALKQMSVKDAANILLGPSDAATQYFKRTTTDSLAAKFRPVVHNSLNKVGATQYYNQAATSYNKVPFNRNKVDPDIENYVTQKAISGLFVEIAQQELQIRQNLPSSRSTALLQKVFSYADQAKK